MLIIPSEASATVAVSCSGSCFAIEHCFCSLPALSGFVDACAIPVRPDFHIVLALINREDRERISLTPMNSAHAEPNHPKV